MPIGAASLQLQRLAHGFDRTVLVAKLALRIAEVVERIGELRIELYRLAIALDRSVERAEGLEGAAQVVLRLGHGRVERQCGLEGSHGVGHVPLAHERVAHHVEQPGDSTATPWLRVS